MENASYVGGDKKTESNADDDTANITSLCYVLVVVSTNAIILEKLGRSAALQAAQFSFSFLFLISPH